MEAVPCFAFAQPLCKAASLQVAVAGSDLLRVLDCVELPGAAS